MKIYTHWARYAELKQSRNAIGTRFPDTDAEKNIELSNLICKIPLETHTVVDCTNLHKKSPMFYASISIDPNLRSSVFMYGQQTVFKAYRKSFNFLLLLSAKLLEKLYYIAMSMY